MQFTNLTIENYKSLRAFSIDPHAMTVIVGANASGKSNFADCIDFLSEVYRLGLEVAVARKGGYENIAHRRGRRVTGSVSIRSVSRISAAEWMVGSVRSVESYNELTLHARHEFDFRAKGTAISAEFQVEKELIELHLTSDDKAVRLGTITRTPQDVIVTGMPSKGTLSKAFPGVSEERHAGWGPMFDLQLMANTAKQMVSPTELLLFAFGRFFGPMRGLVSSLGSSRVFQISPSTSREFGVPTPGPELDRSGGNLPAVVDLLQKKHPDNWAKIMEGMTRVLPDLERIEVGYTTSRTLGLLFQERKIGRPWSTAEVSDGTVQTLALLVALFDPRSTGLVIEEPENSVHPWIIRTVLTACAEASRAKQIIITTHSPIVMNSVRPEQIYVMWRADGESRIAPLTTLDKSYRSMWEQGQVSTFDYLDSGALLAAIPPSPSPEDDE